MGNEMEPNPASTILARWSSCRLLNSLCPVRLLRFNEQEVSIKIPWMFMSVKYSSFFFFLLSRWEKKCEAGHFFLWLLAWLAPVKGSCLQKGWIVWGEKLAKQPCLAAVKQRLTKPEYAWMKTVCTSRFYYKKKSPVCSIYQSSYRSVPGERCFTGSRSNNQSDPGRDWKGNAWRNYSKFKPNLRNNGISSATYSCIVELRMQGTFRATAMRINREVLRTIMQSGGAVNCYFI